MKLFYSPGACSLASHIALREAGQSPQLEAVSFKDNSWSGGDFSKINPKGYIPALQLDSGTVLTEGVAILSFIADSFPQANLLPAGNAANLERASANEWLTYIATELHKAMSPLWSDKTPAEFRQGVVDGLGKRIEFVNRHLANREFMVGNHFTVVDAYLFTVMSWLPYVKIEMKTWPNLAAYMAKLEKRPSVHAAMKAEGLLN